MLPTLTSSFDRVFVGRLPRETTEPQLRAALALEGVEVGLIELILDRVTGLPRGFAFVDRLVEGGAFGPAVLVSLRRAELAGRTLDVRGVCLRRAGAGRSR